MSTSSVTAKANTSPNTVMQLPVGSNKPVFTEFNGLVIYTEILGKGVEQTVHAASLNGREFAVGIGTGPMPDRMMQTFRHYANRISRPSPSFYNVPDYVRRAGFTLTVAPRMSGQGTQYEGLDGLGVITSSISTTTPYPNPAKNALRLMVLNAMLGLRDFHKDARALASKDPRFYHLVHGDFKAQQLLNKPTIKPGIPHPYTTLILGDIPTRTMTQHFSLGFFDPQTYKHSIRYHHDDLFAYQTHLAICLARVLTYPLYKGGPKPIVSIPQDQINKMLISQAYCPLSVTAIKSVAAQGFPFVPSKGKTFVYPSIYNPKLEDTTYNQLETAIKAMPDGDSKEVATYLLSSMYTVLLGREHATACKDNPQEAQQIVIDTFDKIEADIRQFHLPNSGRTGSPITANVDAEADFNLIDEED